MDLDLTGKVALVSGSTRGLGFASAAGLAEMGADVIINGRDDAAVTQAMAKIRQSSPSANLHGAVFDLAGAEGCAALVAQFPEVDILVNNLGFYEPKAFFEIEDSDWMRMFEVNVMSAVRLTRHYLKRMLEHKQSQADAGAQAMGPRRVRLERIRHLCSQGDGALRLLESRTALHRARCPRADQVDRHHGEFGAAGPDLGRDDGGASFRALRGDGNEHR